MSWIIRLFSGIENFLISIRNTFWNYPDILFFGPRSFVSDFKNLYQRSRPFSHSITTIFVFCALLGIFLNDISAVLRIDGDTLIEGVVVGQDDSGKLQKVNFLNPLIITNIQLKRDLSKLVYEPLIRVSQRNDIQKVLAENIADIGAGKTYRIKLREDVYWHDGEKFDAQDVVATFELLKTLEYEEQTSSVFSKAATKIQLTKIDDYRLEFSLVDQNSVIPNFFEVISFKILPEHLLSDLNSTNIQYANPNINRNPIGTGPYISGPLNLDDVVMKRNERYHGGVPKIAKIKFKLYKDQDQAIRDIKTGQIHALIGINSDSIQELSTISNLNIHQSNVIYNQYWAMYFNLNESGKEYLKDEKVRQAISSAINRQILLESLVGTAVEAKGPIPETSFAYTDNIKYKYDIEMAKKLLDEAGWVMTEDSGYRMKDGQVLELDLVSVKNVDRDKAVTVLSRDLENVGIKVNLYAKTISEVNNDHLLPAFFDVLIYGVSTFIDPDRYELFHSSQIGYPNLNIAGYKSAEETTRIKAGKTERVPEVDASLEKGRSIIDTKARIDEYQNFQRIIHEEVPVIFLYHPVYNYITNNRVKDIHLQEMTSLEDRFESINSWSIQVE